MKKFLIWILFSMLFALAIYAARAFIVWEFFSMADIAEGTRSGMLLAWVCLTLIAGVVIGLDPSR